MSENLERRHLNSQQRACAAVNALPFYESEAKTRQIANLKQGNSPVTQKIGERAEPHEGESTQQAAKDFGTNRQYVSDVKKIKETAPKEFESIKAGVTTIADFKRKQKQEKHARIGSTLGDY